MMILADWLEAHSYDVLFAVTVLAHFYLLMILTSVPDKKRKHSGTWTQHDASGHGVTEKKK
jgi:hypothetical protein